MFNLYCPICETAFTATKERAGEVILCRTCQKSLIITCDIAECENRPAAFLIA